MKIKCVRKIVFHSGHRVVEHEGKCAKLHGHEYKAWFYAEAESLDSIGRVIDFSVLKEKIGGWIDRNWDHKTILFNKDPLLNKFSFDQPNYYGNDFDKWGICVVDFNPTAENMAEYLLMEICPALLEGTGVQVKKVEIYETENCKVIAGI